jgi:hypothetical protein
MEQSDMDWWVSAFPADWEMYFEEYHNGLWWLRTQELVGKLFTIGGIILYSDKTVVLRGMQCYPVYSEYHLLQTVLMHNCWQLLVFACVCMYWNVTMHCCIWQCHWPTFTTTDAIPTLGGC